MQPSCMPVLHGCVCVPCVAPGSVCIMLQDDFARVGQGVLSVVFCVVGATCTCAGLRASLQKCELARDPLCVSVVHHRWLLQESVCRQVFVCSPVGGVRVRAGGWLCIWHCLACVGGALVLVFLAGQVSCVCVFVKEGSSGVGEALQHPFCVGACCHVCRPGLCRPGWPQVGMTAPLGDGLWWAAVMSLVCLLCICCADRRSRGVCRYVARRLFCLGAYARV